MDCAVELRRVTGTPLLVVRRRARLDELSGVVPDACGAVWEFIGEAEVPSPGRNVAVYLDCADDHLHLEVGVEVGADAAAAGEIALSATPAGPVATTAHLGPYERLHEAHRAIQEWCSGHGHSLAGPNWEVYGHWVDDPEKLRTDVFYLLVE